MDGLQRKHPQLAESTQNYVIFMNLLYHFGFTEHFKSQQTYAVEPRFPSFFNKSPRILMPLNEMMTAVLPPKGHYKNHINHNPFPSDPLFITGMGQEFDVIQSLQKPKRFSFLASDGKEYDWLIKDDLRIDGLVMDFMSVMNDLMKNDSPCKQRGLKCKPYSVVPIGEDCGLIEWVPHLVPLRDTIFSIYQLLGKKINVKKEIKKEQSSDQKLEIFEKYWIPAHPPVLDYWFSLQFYREDAWYEACRQYVHSTAVMSMIGYILGLGDRHGGNLMLSVATGELVHVDFNCLFNKGERLPWPERVPFRLTQNMISGMGVTGLEGAFVRVCELTLAVIRKNIGTLISVIRPIVFNVSRRDNLAKQKESDEEFINGRMIANIDRVILRMSGYINDRDCNHVANKAYSPQGHARALIKMARDPKNLAQMYPGWGAFM
ncbi:hypothetical protein B566_EDAN015486 [Ephemera danica]|nr:hypothetical protein B566_EDAN015486 [Ephemera danica]